MDNRFLNLIGRLLKAGVEVDGVVHSTEKGVPQGGVASPLLANVVLNRLDWFLHEQGQYGQARDEASRLQRPNVRFVRYADDWCVFITRGSKRYAESLRVRTGELLNRDCGVRLSAEKTRITHIRDGFDFLGFRIAHDFHRAANTLDYHAFWIATKALSRKFDLSTAQCLLKYRTGGTIGMSENCMLLRAQDTTMVYHLRSPDPYRPGTGCYLEDLDWEVGFQILEGRRPGRMDSKVRALFRDGNRCRHCGASVTYEDSEVDQIRPVNCFANFQQANFVTNLQILCLECHGEKTAGSR